MRRSSTILGVALIFSLTGAQGFAQTTASAKPATAQAAAAAKQTPVRDPFSGWVKSIKPPW